METGRVGATPRDVRDMLALYKVDDPQRDNLLRVAREARQRAWWDPYADLAISTFVGIEAEASSIRIYTAQLIPGLLQTEEYARAVLAALLPEAGKGEIERRVELRMARQARFRDSDPPQLWAVIDEAALKRPVGGRETMRKQLRYLVEVADLPMVILQILPFTVGEHAGMDGDFAILGLPEREDPDVLYLERMSRGDYSEEIEDVRRYGLLFDHLRAAALGPADSKTLISAAADELQQSL